MPSLTTDIPAAPPAAPATASLDSARETAAILSGRLPIGLALGLLFVSALPDAMVVPLLNELFVARYGVSVAAAHWFMAINLIGAAAVLPLLLIMRRRLNPATILAIAALANAAFLAVMYLPVGFGATIVARFFEGAADLLVFAVLFDLLAKAGSSGTRGRRLGLAGTVLMFGLFCGVMFGGGIGSGLGTGGAPAVLLFGAAACLFVAAGACLGGRLFNGLVRSCPVVSDTGRIEATRRPLWPALAMVFSDRAIAGLMTATIPLFFGAIAGFSPVMRGWLIGVPLLIMAIGAWPAGWLGDRIGHGRLRATAALLYAGPVASLAWATAWPMPAIFGVMIVLGAAGAALFPTSLAMATGSGRGALATGAHRTAGEIGYLLGIGLAGSMLALLSGAEPTASHFGVIITAFAAAHLLITAITLMLPQIRRRTKTREQTGLIGRSLN